MCEGVRMGVHGGEQFTGAAFWGRGGWALVLGGACRGACVGHWAGWVCRGAWSSSRWVCVGCRV